MIRIYVPYLPVGIGIYLLYLLLPGLSEGGRSFGVLTSFTLLPGNSPPALSVAWTLVHEVIFYALYALWFVHRILFRLVFGAWLLLIMAALFMGWGEAVPPFLRYFLSPLNLCFALGVSVFHLNTRIPIKWQVAWLLVLGGLLLIGVQVMSDAYSRVLVSFGFAAMVWAAASPAASALPVWRPLIGLGAASYAIYLVHNPVLSLLVRFVPEGTSAALAYAAISVGALLAGLLYWWLYERPMLAWVRKRLV